MRKLLFVPVLFFAMSCGGDETPADTSKTSSSTSSNVAAAPQEGTPDAYAVQIANYIIANDNEGLMSQIITQEEMTDVINGSSVTPMGKEVAVKNIPTEISKMRVDYSNGLKEIRTQCEAAGVEWSNCKFKDATIDMNNPTGYFMAQLHCVLECNGQEYKFTVTDVVQTADGWKLGGTMYYGDQPPANPVQFTVPKAN